MQTAGPKDPITGSTAPEAEQRPTLFRAAMSFLSSIALIVFLFFIVGHYAWLGWTHHEPVLQGTYMAGPSSTPAHFATAESAVRFVDGDRAELRMHGRFFDGFYRLEHDRVFVETAEARGPNHTWIFEIVGDRLVGDDVILERQRP